MRLREDEFPVVVQAYDPSGPKDAFVAEQVAYTQAEIDHFTSRYAGLLIKAREVHDVEENTDARIGQSRRIRSRSGNAVGWILFLLVVIIALVVWGFTSGWIQEHFGINPPV
jgi:hypothetical protein